MELVLPSPLVEVDWKIGGETHKIAVKRDDLIHPLISGNKWRKLSLVLEDAHEKRKQILVSFGGAWSNHLLALSAAAKALDFKSVAFIRGDELETDMAGQLAQFRQYGMELLPVSRAAYRDKEALFNQFFGQRDDVYFIDEGGASDLAERGCEAILAENEGHNWRDIWLPAGTGTTLKGVARFLAKKQALCQLHGVLAVQSADFCNQLGLELSAIYPQTQIHLPDNGPRFGKYSASQLAIGLDWYKQTGILPDPVYGLKTLEAIHQSLEKQNPGKTARVLWIHTGGLDGWAGFPEARLLFS